MIKILSKHVYRDFWTSFIFYLVDSETNSVNYKSVVRYIPCLNSSGSFKLTILDVNIINHSKIVESYKDKYIDKANLCSLFQGD